MFGIKIKSDDTLEKFDYNGLESMQEAVGGYIEYVGSRKIQGIDCTVFCNEEFLFIDTEECKRYNPIASSLSPFDVDLYGDCIIVADNEDHSDSRGFTEEEYGTLVKEVEKFKVLNKDTIAFLHLTCDRKEVM